MDRLKGSGEIRKGYSTALVILIFAGALLIRFPHLDDPFIRPHEDDNSRYGLAARNHLRFGPIATKFSNCLTPSGFDPAPDDFYFNHPPTLSFLLAGSFAIFGESERAIRLVPLLFSMIGLIVLHGAVRRRWDDKTALYAAAAYAFVPFSIYYGKLATFMPVILPLGIMAIDTYSSRRFLPATLTACAVAVDYGGLFILPGILLAYGWNRRFLPVAVAGLAVFGIHMASIAFFGGTESLHALLAKAGARAGIGDSGGLLAFIKQQVIDYFAYAFTPVGALLAAGGLLVLDRSRTERKSFVLALLIWGLGYIIVFNNAARIHDYWQYYLLGAGAVLFGLAMARLNRFVALILLVIFLDQSMRILDRRYYGDIGWYAPEFEAIEFARAHAEPGDIVLTRESIRSTQPLYYSPVRFEHDPGLEERFRVRQPAAPQRE